MSQETLSATASVAARSLHDRVGLIGVDRRLKTEVKRALRVAGLTCEQIADTAAELPAASELDAVIVCEGGDPATVLEAVRRSRAILPSSPLIVIWPATSVGELRRVLLAATDGLVDEEDLARELNATVSAVCAGLTCIPAQYRAMLDAETLSMREKQILGMLVRGFTNAEIATRLYLAESTVKSHLSSAYAKLGVRSRQAAATMILDPEHGLGPGILAISAA